MTSSPIVSVVLPVRNAERTIDEALTSLSQQTFPEFEVLAIDDGSTDATAERLRRAAAADSRFRTIRTPARGTTAALVHGLSEARGRYIARQDGDDVSLPDRLRQQVDYLESHENVCAVGTAAITIDESGNAIGTFPMRHGAAAVRAGIRSISATPVHGSVLMRRECLEQVQGYRPAFLRCQDFDLWLRLLERWDIDNLAVPLYKWRLSASSAYGEARRLQLMYGGIAAAFAEERHRYGSDSYALLDSAQGDLEGFARSFRLQSVLRAIWGELLLRGTNDSRLANQHLSRAVTGGHLWPRTVLLWLWTGIGLPWMGSKPLRAPVNPTR